MDNLDFARINYDAIKTFLCVAKHGSLTHAANSLGVSQSALSQSMKNLEQSLGLTLFVRNTRGIILTEEGRVLYEQAKIGDEQFKHAIVETLRAKSFRELGSFKISITSSLTDSLLTPKLKQLQAKFNVNFEIVNFSSENKVVENLQKEKFDLAIFKTNEDFIVKEVAMEKLCERNYVFVYNPKYFNPKDNISMEELNKYPIINKGRTGRNDNSWMKFSFNKFITCNSDYQCLDLIKNGVGIGVYPKELAKQEKLNVLKVEGYKPTKRVVNACYLWSNNLAREIVNILM